MINFSYGARDNFIDITDIVLREFAYSDHILIPANDILRAHVFTDPLYGVEKDIIVTRQQDGTTTRQTFDANTHVVVQLNGTEIPIYDSASPFPLPADKPTDDIIRYIHSQLSFVGGTMTDEWNEQSLSVRYLNPNAHVLELGSNIGRNTLMISSLLNDDRNLVTLECDPASVDVLYMNRFINKRKFHVEPSALSYRKLIQRNWDTIPSDVLLDGYNPVQTITYEALLAKYSIPFDTLVIDCEGAIYFILNDNPNILDNISTIILESDYHSAEQKNWVDALFTEKGLQKIYSEPLLGHDWLPFPDECRASFYEVWKK